jgi:hypothetical protein
MHHTTAMMNTAAFVLFVISTLFLEVSTLSAAAPWQSFLSSLLPSAQSQGDAKTVEARARAELKQQLYQVCRNNYGKSNAQIRNTIESVIDELVTLNPTINTATSPLLMKEWDL